METSYPKTLIDLAATNDCWLILDVYTAIDCGFGILWWKPILDIDYEKMHFNHILDSLQKFILKQQYGHSYYF
jgi:hypothetical protein